MRDRDRKSTRLNSSHQIISYAVFCLKKKKNDPARFFFHRKDLVVFNKSRRFFHIAAHHTILSATYHFGCNGYFSRASFFFNDPPPTEIYTLSLHDALPI